MDDLTRRLKILYAAVGATIDDDLSKYRGQVFVTPKTYGVYNDFRGGRTDDQLLLLIQSAIHNIASLRDHIKRWADARGRPVSKVNDAIVSSRPLQIITDLWNLDKHAELDRKPWSGMVPKLANVNSFMRSTARPGQGCVVQQFDMMGRHSTNVPGSATVIVDADILDEHGTRIGSFQELADKAVYDWEQLIQRLT